jgi:hypothetical protein
MRGDGLCLGLTAELGVSGRDRRVTLQGFRTLTPLRPPPDLEPVRRIVKALGGSQRGLRLGEKTGAPLR